MKTYIALQSVGCCGDEVVGVTHRVDKAVELFMASHTIELWIDEKKIADFSQQWGDMQGEDAHVIRHNFLQLELFNIDELDTSVRLWKKRSEFSDF